MAGSAPINIEKLESHLWEAANILRGPVDAEYALFPQNYRFQIPDDCHWRE